MSTTALMYGTREMQPDPINTTFGEVVERLEHGHPVIVELEPGDATYYSLLIVPARAAYVAPHLGRFGIPADQAHRFLIVTKLSDQEGSAFYATEGVGPWDLHGIDNDWSRELIAWWLRILWEHLYAYRLAEQARGPERGDSTASSLARA